MGDVLPVTVRPFPNAGSVRDDGCVSEWRVRYYAPDGRSTGKVQAGRVSDAAPLVRPGVAKLGNTGYPGGVADTAAQLLRRLRQEQGRSLRAAARDLGVDPSYLSRVENGERSASDELGVRIADYYGLDKDTVDLFAGRAPSDIVEILRSHPELMNELRTRYG